jgi:hypothetical protein
MSASVDALAADFSAFRLERAAASAQGACSRPGGACSRRCLLDGAASVFVPYFRLPATDRRRWGRVALDGRAESAFVGSDLQRWHVAKAVGTAVANVQAFPDSARFETIRPMPRRGDLSFPILAALNVLASTNHADMVLETTNQADSNQTARRGPGIHP